MIEFKFYKGGGWVCNPKFSIKVCNNGEHRMLIVAFPHKPKYEGDYNWIEYTIIFWKNKRILDKQDDDLEPSLSNN